MIEKINLLRNETSSDNVKRICENAITSLSSTIYNDVTPEAKDEIERATVKNLFESLSEYDLPEVKDWLINAQRINAIQNIGVKESINFLARTEGKTNDALMETLETFKDRAQHTPEVLLYEEYTTALQSFSYFPKVGNAIEAINDRVSTYKNDVDITKILETMKGTKSSYLIPLIEDVVYNYLNNKNRQTKSQLKESLMKFTYDPFVRDIVNLVTLDASELQLEQTNAGCDVEKVYSPVMYLGENEAVFNIRGKFYVKKGNNVSRIKNEDVNKLDESFVNLCNTLNENSNVVFENDTLVVYGNTDVARIDENGVHINDKTFLPEDFQSIMEEARWAGKTDFYMLVEFLSKNYNDIAEINFVKRVSLKENASYAADVFKLRDNIFISTHDPLNGKSTFFRNVNPIQAKTIMNEHLNFDVTNSLNIIPDEEKLENEIRETRESYETYINELNEKIDQFRNNTYGENVSNQVIQALEEEIQDVRNEYKDYLNLIENYKNPTDFMNEDDFQITIKKGDKTYIVPIPDENNNNKDGDDEFGSEVGDEYTDQEAASAVTFDDDETELLGDSPSMETSDIDLGAEEAEEEAEEAEKEAEEEEDDDIKIEDEVDIEDEDETEEEKKKDKKKKKNESTEGKRRKVYLKKKKVNEADDPDKKDRDRERTDISQPWEREGEYDELFVDTIRSFGYEPNEVNEMPEEKKKKFFDTLDKKWKAKNESVKKKKSKALNENAQLGDKVIYDKQRGYVIGQTSDGDLIVQVQGSTHKANPDKVKVFGAKAETMKPPFKFDETTQKVLFEQWVKCGIYMQDTPIKTSDCYVNYAEWNKKDLNEDVNVMVEGSNSIMKKENIRVFEDVNDFANLDNYVEGVEIDEETGDAISNILINAIDYTDAQGDADAVRIIRGHESEDPMTDVLPAARVRTLSV